MLRLKRYKWGVWFSLLNEFNCLLCMSSKKNTGVYRLLSEAILFAEIYR